MSLLTQAAPCPWCEGRNEHGKPEHGVWLWDKARPGWFAIACSNPDCAATGPFARDGAEAVLAWNSAPRRVSKTRPALRRLLDEAHGPDAERELEPGYRRSTP